MERRVICPVPICGAKLILENRYAYTYWCAARHYVTKEAVYAGRARQ